MRELTELEGLLLIQAFDGRPLHIEYDVRSDRHLLMLEHENGQHRCQLTLNEPDVALLVEDLEDFKERIADPMIHNLDGAAYPERWERLMPTYKRAAELLANGRSAR